MKRLLIFIEKMSSREKRNASLYDVFQRQPTFQCWYSENQAVVGGCFL